MVNKNGVFIFDKAVIIIAYKGIFTRNIPSPKAVFIGE
jgi:hypothetical protein